MFHPMVAGVTIPGIGIFGMMLAPYSDRNPSQKPEDRKFAIALFTCLPHVLGRSRHHRLVLPGAGLQLHPALARRPVLRPVRSSTREPLVSAGAVLAIVIAGVVVLAVRPAVHHRPPPRREPRHRPAVARDTRPRSQRASDRRGARRPRAAAGHHRTRGRARRGARARRRAQGRAPRHHRAAEAAGAPTRRRGTRRHPPPVPQPRHRHPVHARAGQLRRVDARLPLADTHRRLRLEDHGPAASTTSWRQIADKKEPFYVAEGRFYINPYPKDAVGKAKAIAAYGAVLPGYEAGVVALYQKCVHLGCRVPWCATSQWFECPCHGSQYNRVGEKKGGPAPRGLDRFVVTVDGGHRQRRHQGDHRRPADRHQHHGPGGRGPPLRMIPHL